MKSKIENLKEELADLMETKNDPSTPSDIKEAIKPAIEKLKLLIKDEEDKVEKPSQSKVSKAPEKKASVVKTKKETESPKKSSSSLERCKEIIAKYREKKASDARRVEKRRKAGKPAELTPAETIKKAAKSVKAKVVEMDKGLKVSDETSIINAVISSVVSAIAGIKEPYKKKIFINKIIMGLKKLDSNISGTKVAERGMYLHEVNGDLMDDNADMLRLNIVEIEHHASEILNSLKSGVEVEGWVLSRSVRAKTDMSDIAHNLDSTLKADSMADGGYMAKGGFNQYGEPYGFEDEESESDSVYEIHHKPNLNKNKPYLVWDKIDGVYVAEFANNQRAIEFIENKKYGYMAKGGEVRHFDRHKEMDSETREYILYKIKELGYVDSDKINTLFIENYLYGLFDGYDYSQTKKFKDEMRKLKSIDANLYNDIKSIYQDKINKYNFTEKKDGGYMAKGGRTLSSINRDRSYKSNEDWEERYNRKTAPKNPRYNRYDLGGQTSVKKYPDLSKSKETLIN